jgi:sensor c-di-GMP phosphodiesterase-like protein
MYVDEIQSILKHVAIGKGGYISLRDSGFGLIARNVDDHAKKISIGNKALSTPFKISLKKNPNEGTFVSDSTSIDKIRRLHSYRRSPQYGYIINVGVSTDTIFAEWHKQVWLISSILLVFSLLVFAYARFVSRA